MPTDYEQVYRAERHALGQPTAAFVEFFDIYDQPNASVLDLGCGQGRDALFIARKGHRVLGVDLSLTGIAHLLEDAQSENLNIQGVVADLRDYEPSGAYDVVVIDRTLHMLADEVHMTVLARVAEVTKPGGYILIADESYNLPAMRQFFQQQRQRWTTVKDQRGLLFMKKAAQ